jgi:ribosomal-protein-serine acetyltransferase
VAANRAYLAHWLPWAAGQTRGHTSAFIERTREQLARNDGFQAAVVEDRAIIGIVGFHGVSWPSRTATIGYWLAESAQGRGIMTGAVRLLADHGLAVWQLNRVEIRAAVDNARSRAIPERLGFSLDGVLPNAEVVGGRFLDHAVYAMRAPRTRGS